MNTGEGKADKPLAERMEQKAGEEGTDISLRPGTTRAGDGRDTSPQGQREQQADTEDSALSDIPEWILEENIRLNRAITPPADQFIRDQGERNDGDCGPAAVIGLCSTWAVEPTPDSDRDSWSGCPIRWCGCMRHTTSNTNHFYQWPRWAQGTRCWNRRSWK